MPRRTDNEVLLAKVPLDGTAIGNKRLRELLKWDYEKYFRVRNRLVEDGEIFVGQGKGGSVFLSPASDLMTGKRKNKDKPIDRREIDCYESVQKSLGNYWIKELFPSITDFEIKTTAHLGSRPTGGVWTRPDIAVYGYGAHRFYPGRTYDLISFEVKLAERADVRAVFEAKGHSRRASRSYVICVGSLEEEYKAQLVLVARDQRIGLMVAPDADDPESWEPLTEAVRREPDPAWVDEFVRQNFDEQQQRRIEAWCR